MGNLLCGGIALAMLVRGTKLRN
jgi:hypothetical protein